MKRNKFILIVVVSFIMLIITGCIYDGPNKTVNDVTNKVTNEITQSVVDYNSNITIEDLEDAVTTATKMVENAVIGVTLKEVKTSTINGKKYTFEDNESVGSGVIYKRIDNTLNGNTLSSYTYYCITNAHVILSDDNNEHVVYAYLGNYNTEIKAEVIGYDEKIDLAVIKFDSYYLNY